MESECLKPGQRNRGFRVRAGLLAGIVILSLAAGLGALSFTHHVPRPAFSAPVPRLELSASRLDLGEGKPNELLHGSLQLRNVGSEVLEFEITASCGCTELTPRRGTIPAGNEQDVRLAVQLPDHANSERSVQLVIKTNDPQHPAAGCSIVAKCPAPFRVTPAFVDFGKISRGTTSVKPAEVRVTVAEGEHRRVCTRLADAAFVVVSEQPGLVRVAPAGDLAFGDHHGTLELFLEGSEDRVVRVPLRVQVPAPLSVTPSTLTLRRDSAGQFSPVYWIVAGESGSAPLGEVQAVNAPREFRIEEVGQIGDRRRRYRLTIEEGWKAPERFSLELVDASNGQRCEVLLLSGSSDK
jgi:hypothetical protein